MQYSTAFLCCARQLAAADHPTCGLMMTAAAQSVCAGLQRRSTRSASDASVQKQQRRVYCKLVTQKREAFWQHLITQQSRTPRQMWQSIDNLLDRGQLPADTAISSTDFHRFLDKKVEDIRASTSGAANPVYSVQSHRVFPGFRHFQVSLQSLWMKSHPQY